MGHPHTRGAQLGLLKRTVHHRGDPWSAIESSSACLRRGSLQSSRQGVPADGEGGAAYNGLLDRCYRSTSDGECRLFPLKTLNCVPHQVLPRRRRWTLAGMPSKHTVPPGHSPPESRISSSISCSASGRSRAKRVLEGVVAAAAWRRLRRRACSLSSSRPPRRCVREGDSGIRRVKAERSVAYMYGGHDPRGHGPAAAAEPSR